MQPLRGGWCLPCCASPAGFSVLAGAGFVLLGAPLAELVYRDAMVGRYVQILGLAAPFMYLESMVDGVLKGLGEAAGHLPVFAAGFGVPHHSHPACAAAVRYGRLPVDYDCIKCDDLRIEYEKDDEKDNR